MIGVCKQERPLLVLLRGTGGARSVYAGMAADRCPLCTLTCSYSEQLEKWIEVGNSGMFRPEMLRPMGLPEGVNVIAWGLGLER